MQATCLYTGSARMAAQCAAEECMPSQKINKSNYTNPHICMIILFCPAALCCCCRPAKKAANPVIVEVPVSTVERRFSPTQIACPLFEVACVAVSEVQIVCLSVCWG
mmetsp:Transcript_11344/g.21255  ORF Transcript_11344/g.21255 Transcript_11344/m.21255 type:complete len:107 (+) Transcript_11344:168-488(+)